MITELSFINMTFVLQKGSLTSQYSSEGHCRRKRRNGTFPTYSAAAMKFSHDSQVTTFCRCSKKRLAMFSLLGQEVVSYHHSSMSDTTPVNAKTVSSMIWMVNTCHRSAIHTGCDDRSLQYPDAATVD
jgi:hypothetical protein